MMKRVFRLAALVLAAVLLLTACSGGPQSTNQQPAAGEQGSASNQGEANSPDVLVIAMPSDVGTLDPHVSMDNQSWKVTYVAYDRLVRYKEGSTDIEGALAESWQVSEDGLQWTFRLRPGVKFQDGTPLDAHAVKFSFDRLKKIGQGPSDAFPTLKAVEVVDPLTVRFVLSEPFAPFLSTLATNGASIVNPKVMEHEKDGDMGQNYLAEHTMGSGPYKLAEWVKDQYLKLEANPDWWGGKPKFKTVIIKIVKEPAAQRLQLEKGDIDIAEGITIDQIAELRQNPDIAIVESPGLMVDYMYINTQRPALRDKRVRQAISYAIDYQGIIASVQQGYATQMRGPIPKGLWGHDETVMQYGYDPDRARSLLQEAGATGLRLELIYADRMPWWEQEAQIIQANLAEVGIQVQLTKLAWPTLRERVDRGEFDLCLGIWSPDYADPYMFMNYWFDSDNWGLAGNRAFYKNDQVDRLLREAARLTDRNERTKLYSEVQRIVMEDAPYVLLYQKNFVLPMRKTVRGFTYNPMLEGIYNLESMSKE